MPLKTDEKQRRETFYFFEKLLKLIIAAWEERVSERVSKIARRDDWKLEEKERMGIVRFSYGCSWIIDSTHECDDQSSSEISAEIPRLASGPQQSLVLFER